MEKERMILLNGKLTIRLPKDLDHHTSTQIRLDADRLLDMHPVEKLILDFEETDFMDSSGIGVIVGRYKRVSYMGGRTIAIHMNAQVKKVFHLSGLDQIISVEDKNEEDTYKCQ